MKLEKISNAYKLSDEFCSSMKQFQKDKKMYGELDENHEYFKLENETEKMITNNKTEMFLGSLGYLIRHPKTMINSQKYYNEDFGIPCKMKKI